MSLAQLESCLRKPGGIKGPTEHHTPPTTASLVEARVVVAQIVGGFELPQSDPIEVTLSNGSSS